MSFFSSWFKGSSSAPSSSTGTSVSPINGSVVAHRLPTKGYKKELPICSMVITINSGSSYDHLYTSVEQVSPSSDYAISLWEVNYNAVTAILNTLNGSIAIESIQELVDDLKRIEPASVLVNFECCSGCSDSGFGNRVAMPFIKKCLDSGYMVQFGDFSTKALIKDWDQSLLGPKPFKQIGTFSSTFKLKFNPDTLVNSASAQLKIVGGLCREKGGAQVSAMGGTVRFTVNKANTDNKIYDLQVLTVLTHHDTNVEKDGNEQVTFNGEVFKGSVGHAILKFKTVPDPSVTDKPTHAYMVVSAGHWMELSKLDTDIKFVERQMKDMYGETEAKNFMNEYNAAPALEQASMMQKKARSIVQTSACSNYSIPSKSKS
ncbi:hypothetical protein SAMD00019534_064530 [Acytostelium subglobosum LB1]|uniref:hypothetical protein n=1 Tax=Acytostelium subglobosum LB1 TaxID=1410327 RepID=UPI0006451645|nr:hypothetical protein SAMD00019534_064530 [Acytostelium subglobosum LB1]GAM23278.1 hypothetical protein SAMD00019534_064530 [Acytostelium subglobosum LB1]|eukprot:XP_012753727.1 hypothetical protein SAMD00019534_064530 [Acytostelium subglobosum LB1]